MIEQLVDCDKIFGTFWTDAIVIKVVCPDCDKVELRDSRIYDEE